MVFSLTVQSGKSLCAGSLDYLTFISVMQEADLADMANRRVFNIFDSAHTGYINMQDFLLTMAAFNTSMNRRLKRSVSLEWGVNETQTQHLEEARVYFDIFDMNGRGYIELHELKLVVGCFNMRQSAEFADKDVCDIDLLFSTMDPSGSGRVEFDQFASFFKRLSSSLV